MPSRTKLDCLDGLRGIAILLVIGFHHRLLFEDDAVRTAFYRACAPFRFGHIGVNLFLVLSGFCLTHSLLRRIRSGRTPTLRGYLVDRWRRIGPPYYVALGIYVAAAWLVPDHRGYTPVDEPISPLQVFSHLFFLHGLGGDTIEALNSSFWSLSLEFQFYAVLPLLFVLGERWGRLRMLVAVLAVSLAWRLGFAARTPELFYLGNGFFAGRWGEFAAGMLIAWWYNDPRRETATSPRAEPGLLSLAFALLAVAVGMQVRGRLVGFGAEYFYGAGFAVLLVAGLVSSERDGRLGRILGHRGLVWVGSISYSLYLMHSLVLAWLSAAYHAAVPVRSTATDAAEFLLALVLIGLAGWAFHHGVERRFMRSIDGGPPPPRVAETATGPLPVPAAA